MAVRLCGKIKSRPPARLTSALPYEPGDLFTRINNQDSVGFPEDQIIDWSVDILMWIHIESNFHPVLHHPNKGSSSCVWH